MRYFGLYMPPTDSIHTCISKLPCQWFKKIKIVTTFRNFLFYVHINWNIGIVDFSQQFKYLP